MSQSQGTDLRNHLLRQDAAQVQEWLRSVWAGQVKAPKEYNWWVGLAQGAAFSAREAEPPDLAWAQVATSIYDRLAVSSNIKTTVTNGITESDDMRSSMMLRAYMILRLGSVPGDPILDIDRIIRWFFETLKMSLEEATKKAAFWQEGLKTGNPFKELSWDDVRALRYIKSRLNVIKELSKTNEFKPTKELNAWLTLWKELP